MSEGFLFVETGIKELLRLQFSHLESDISNNIIGYWIYPNAYEPCAKWEKGNFSWINK